MRSLFPLAVLSLLLGCSSTTITEPGSSDVDTGEPAEVTTANSVAESETTSTDVGDSASVPVAAGKAELSPENTTIQFVGTHTSDDPKPRTGVFQEFMGTATVDAGKLKSVTVEIRTDSLATPIDKLTNHLKSVDFFDVRQYPTAKFESTEVAYGPSETVVTGNLTLLETTREISFPAQVDVTEDGLTLNAQFEIDRTEFGMTFGQDNVNKEVRMTVLAGKKTELP